MPLETEPYDVVDYLTDAESINAYLQAILEDCDAKLLAKALDDAVRAYGFARLAQDTGIPYRDVVRALNVDNRNNLDSLLKVVDALGVKTPTKTAA